MRFNIISNLTNGVGLQQDYERLRLELEVRGHIVHGVQFNASSPAAMTADVNIFLEVVTPSVFPFAPVQWAVPNPEWWFAAWDHYPWDLVLAKTRDCERIFALKGKPTQFLGWAARDLYDKTITRTRKFLHVQGKSQFKNTPAVVMGCHQASALLTIVSQHGQNRRWITQDDLKRLMNSHFCHIMPSAYEGYGHVLHEARGCGQVIITTDAPPMNEVIPALLVPSLSTSKYHEGTLHKVSSHDIALRVHEAMAMSEQDLQRWGDEGRAQFQAETAQFRTTLNGLVGRA